jgi:hypothetical protein
MFSVVLVVIFACGAAVAVTAAFTIMLLLHMLVASLLALRRALLPCG